MGSGIELSTPDGSPVHLDDYAAPVLVVILVRYYGCLPCQSYVIEVDAQTHRFPEGSRVIAVGGSADFQAAWLADEKAIQMPLLMDPDQKVRALADIGNMRPAQFASITGGLNYLRSMRQGLRPQRITSDTVWAPGVVILDEEMNPVWSYTGEFLGDYPKVDDLIEAATAQTR